jgi:hypothetical protein
MEYGDPPTSADDRRDTSLVGEALTSASPSLLRSSLAGRVAHGDACRAGQRGPASLLEAGLAIGSVRSPLYRGPR